MSGPLALDALDLAALLCSRVCHDLISPTGAIVNGLEVLEEDGDAETKTFALDLIKRSAKAASARLQFCRIAFGAAGSSGAKIDLRDAEAMARGFLEDEKTRLEWRLPPALLPKNHAKLLLNMLVVATQTIPRGGTLTVDAIGQPESMGFESMGSESTGFRVTAIGPNARIPQSLPNLLAGEPGNGTVDAHGIQPFYTGLLAKACGLALNLALAGEAIILETR